MSNLLEIVSVSEPTEAKDGRMYKKIGFQELPEQINGQAILSNEPVRYRNVWNFGPRKSEEEDFSKGDPLYQTAKVGAFVKGSIHTETVMPYVIPGNEEPVNTYSLVKFAHETKASAFKSHGHPLVSQTVNGATSDERLNFAEKEETPEAEKTKV